MSSVPEPVLGATGYVAPAEADVLAAVLADISSAFGGGLNTALSTPQGQLASSIAAVIGDKNNLFLDYVNKVDPRYSSGRMQDAHGYIYFMERVPSRPTTVQCLCTGLVGTPIALNAQAKDQANNLYVCSVAATIGSDGTVTTSFTNVVNGPTPCPAGTLDTIYGAIPGWDTITNVADGVLGNLVESPQEFEVRRKNSVALNAIGILPSVFAEVASSGKDLDPPNIPTDVYVTQNVTSENKTVKGVLLVPHSVYVAAEGGDTQAIADAIWRKTSGGCDYNGNTTVNVQDQDGYDAPFPTYAVKYQVPAGLAIKFLVTIAASDQLPSDVNTLIKNAIVDAFSGLDGGSRARIGQDVFASRYYSPVINSAAGVEIVSILVGTSTANANSVTVRIDQFPTITSNDIVVVIQ
jgi:hypothetical protein